LDIYATSYFDNFSTKITISFTIRDHCTWQSLRKWREVRLSPRTPRSAPQDLSSKLSSYPRNTHNRIGEKTIASINSSKSIRRKYHWGTNDFGPTHHLIIILATNRVVLFTNHIIICIEGGYKASYKQNLRK
jgi:hypothetical protein